MKKPSNAKINLSLRVVGKDNRGYHLLESFFALLNIYDDIAIEKAEQTKCSVVNAVIKENVVLNAVKALERYVGKKLPVAISVHKRIPIGAGLGGGSSNAASAIKLINELYELNLEQTKLAMLGSEVGSDVPFFIFEKNAFIQGTGEIITPITLQLKLYILLVNPKITILTKNVYTKSISHFSPKMTEINRSIIVNQILECRNDLEEPAIFLVPEIADILSIIKRQKGCVISKMSGSGSTCFGLFETEENMLEALYNLQRVNPSFWYYTQIIDI